MVDYAAAIILRVLEGTASADDVAAEEAFTVFPPARHWQGFSRG